MAEQESLGDAKRFGSFLRKVRERKRLSLDAVEEMSSGYSERLTKSHLSRIENGLAEPSVRKLFALSQIYGMRSQSASSWTCRGSSSALM